jgi:hypothetical protein
VFLFGVHKPAGAGLKSLLARRRGANLFVIFDGPSTHSEPIDAGLLHLIDLTQFANQSNWADTFPYSSLPYAVVIERRYQLGKPVEPAFSLLFGETSDIADRDTFQVLFVSAKMNGKLFFGQATRINEGIESLHG